MAQVGETLAYQHPLGGLHAAEVLEVQPDRIICRVALGWIQIKHFDPRTGISTRGADDGLIVFQIPKIQEDPCQTNSSYFPTHRSTNSSAE